MVLTAGTDADPKSKSYLTDADWKRSLALTNENAVRKGYDILKENHLKDYQSRFNRVQFDLGNKKQTIPTDQLIETYGKGKFDTALDVLLFQYGRYLTLASSREGFDMPSNLQGIWNNSNTPPWESDIHSNINVQMNYWPTEVGNLAESHLPFINYIYNESMLQDSWKNHAKELGIRGWTMKTQNNAFGYSDWHWHRPANAWYSMHLWEKYLFDPDIKYLQDIAYPVMKSAAEFWIDRLYVDDEGYWVAPNEWSPEHGPWENGLPYAQQLIWDLFQNTVAAAKVLNIESKFTQKLENKLAKLDSGLHIGSWGQLREWKFTEDDPENKHRHISHLVGLYPGRQISPIHTPDFADAARTTLEARGDSGTGWSRVWKIAYWARLLDGNRAHKLLRSALELTDDTGTDFMDKGGVYENLLCAHPPFQIDGNLGVTACMSEMLLQSHLQELHLLPALPNEWQSGSISGLRARGGYEVNLKWVESQLSEGIIKAQHDGVCTIRTNIAIKIEDMDPYASSEDSNGYFLTTFPVTSNTAYKISPEL